MAEHYDRIVSATILMAAYTGSRSQEQAPWTAEAKTISTAQGVPKGSLFRVHRTGDSAACDDGEPKPELGEIWILYLVREGSKYYPAYSIPFHKARRMDARFRETQRSPTALKSPQLHQ